MFDVSIRIRSFRFALYLFRILQIVVHANNFLNFFLVNSDPYLNTDAGTMSPFEHGEVYVLDDGGEVDKFPSHIFLYSREDFLKEVFEKAK